MGEYRVNFPDNIHKELKIVSIEDNKDMNDIVVEQVQEYLKKRNNKKKQRPRNH